MLHRTGRMDRDEEEADREELRDGGGENKLFCLSSLPVNGTDPGGEGWGCRCRCDNQRPTESSV